MRHSVGNQIFGSHVIDYVNHCFNARLQKILYGAKYQRVFDHFLSSVSFYYFVDSIHLLTNVGYLSSEAVCVKGHRYAPHDALQAFDVARVIFPITTAHDLYEIGDRFVISLVDQPSL